MSTYGLIKITSRIQRADTNTDLIRLNQWLNKKGLKSIIPYSPTLRALENSVSLAIEKIPENELPEFVRGESFYRGCIVEIKDKERQQFNTHNSLTK